MLTETAFSISEKPSRLLIGLHKPVGEWPLNITEYYHTVSVFFL